MKDYPELFVNIKGIECNEGWIELIRFVCKSFAHIVKEGEAAYIRFSQIKEKFGLLRIYFDYAASVKTIKKNTQEENELFHKLHTIVGTVESLSGSVCEDCGRIQNENLKVETMAKHGLRGGWTRTLCEECRNKE
jgi:hypothetical protein